MFKRIGFDHRYKVYFIQRDCSVIYFSEYDRALRNLFYS